MSSVAASRPAAARSTVLARVALALIGAAQLEIGVWALLAPHSFWRDYPGAGHHWVSGLGTYNEHLLRDYAGTELGFAVLLIATAIWFERRLVLIAGTAFLAATLPHFAYHVTTAESFSTADNVGSLGGFVVEMLVVAGAMVVASKKG